MTLGNTIAQYRKKMNITQDALAQRLGVTNQAVSKWESDQCCPDVMLLPKLADIFGITLDELFGREVPPAEAPKTEEKKSGFERIFGISLEDLHAKANQQKWNPPEPVWPDDGTLRIVAYRGHELVESVKDLEKLTFQYEGPALNVHSQISVSCGDVEGDVDAGRDVACKGVGGDVDAGRDVSCCDVGGDVDAGRTVCCGNIGGDVDAGTSVSCGNVQGDVDAGSHVGCGQVGGSVDAGTDVKCGDIFGDVDAGGNVECTRVEGDIEAGGSVTIRQ